MKTTKRIISALLAALLTLTLAACDKDSGGGKVDVPATQTGTDDFQKNLHQTEEMYFLETDTGYYVGYGYLYYLDKETMKMTIVCGKPECDHTELATGKLEKLADTHEQTQYGSAVFFDDYMCLLNDIPVVSYNDPTPKPGSNIRSNGDTIFLYGIDGTLLKEISLKPLFDELGDVSIIDMLMCDATDVYFQTTSMTFSTQSGWSVGNPDTVTLCRANFETGEVTQIYKLR